MSNFAEDISTIVRVNMNTEGLESAVDIFKSDENLSLFTDIISDLEDKVMITKQVAGSIAYGLSYQLTKYQQELTRHHYQTGMMFNSYDILEDSDVSRIVTNTAVNPFNNFPYPVIFETGSVYYAGDPYIDDSINALDEDVEDAVEDHLDQIWM